MHFEHDTYDIDVYSLCESVYYSCNNDEYDYVLECVNDWIMNGYNDNILLEDIVLNELTNEGILKLLGNKYVITNPKTLDTDYADKSELEDQARDNKELDQKRMAKMSPKQKENYAEYQAMRARMASARDDLNKGLVSALLGRNTINRETRKYRSEHPDEFVMGPTAKHFLMTSKDYDTSLKALQQARQDFRRTNQKDLKDGINRTFLNSSELELPNLRSVKRENQRYKGRSKRQRKQNLLVQEKNHPMLQYQQQLKKQQNQDPRRTAGVFFYNGRTIKKLGTGFKGRKTIKPAQTPPNTPPAPSFQSRYEQAKKNSQGRLESLRKQQEEERNNILTRYNQAREAARQRLEDKKGKPAEAVPEKKVEKQQENPLQTPSNSNTPLKDKKGRTIKKLGTGFKGRKTIKPAQTPPNTPPQQQEPPNSNTPAVTSRVIKRYTKINKVTAALGAAAIGGGIYAYKQYKNKPRSVIAKRIAALRGIYHKFMINAQRNPQKANIFKRISAKILSVIDKLMAFMQNATN